MQKLLREKSEDIIQIKEKSDCQRLPFGILLEGSDAIKQFADARQTDIKNEMRPN